MVCRVHGKGRSRDGGLGLGPAARRPGTVKEVETELGFGSTLMPDDVAGLGHGRCRQHESGEECRAECEDTLEEGHSDRSVWDAPGYHSACRLGCGSSTPEAQK
jgi:hypothetical protein